MKKIGSKNTSKARYRGTAYKCDLCGRKFMSIDALKSHQRSVHNLHPDKSRVKQYGKQAKKLEVKEKLVKKAAVMETTVTPNRTTRAKTEKVHIEPQTEQNKSTKTVEFECPKCFKSFHTYILASRHIQKFHCVDKKGGKVSPHSATIIQPERKELCLKCKRKVRSIPSHICGVANKMVEEEGLIYNCTACETTFNNKRTFYTHVITSHPDGVESLFFPTNTDFMKWKEEMEMQTNTKYSELDKFDSKCYYHCGFKSGNAAKASINICPSVIVIQEFTKGIQVHYYKKHYRHGTKDYKLLNKYKKFSITAFLKSSDSYFDLTDIKSDDNDMYVQFKKLMESIVLDAAKLKMDTLTVMFGKALEMTTILTGYDDDMSDDGSRPMKRNMTDTQIVNALEESTNNDENIEEGSSEPLQKKLKNNIEEAEAPTPMILNSFSLADNSIKENNISEPLEMLNIKVKELSTLQDSKEMKENSQNIDITKDAKIDLSKTDTIPSSFNESYAEFLEKNFPETEPFGKRRSDRRNIMKTKIGQYKPPSPKKVLSNTTQETKGKPVSTPTLVPKVAINNASIVETKRKQSPGVEEKTKRKLITTTAQDKEQQSNSTSIQDTKRKSVRTTIQNSKFKNVVTPIQETKRKPITPIQDTKVIKSNSPIQETKRKPITLQDTKVIKSNSPIQETKRKPITPIQDTKVIKSNSFIQETKRKPITTIQDTKVIKSKPRTLEKIKVDIEYEVKEREDDCNILILKI